MASLDLLTEWQTWDCQTCYMVPQDSMSECFKRLKNQETEGTIEKARFLRKQKGIGFKGQVDRSVSEEG